jgi:hypothetical protein
MNELEVAGIVLGVVLGVVTLLPVVIRLVIHPGAWEMWTGLALAAGLLIAFFVLGYAAEWGGCDADPQEDTLVCEGRSSECAVTQWDPACRRRSRGCEASIPRGRYCAAGQTPRFEYCETFVDGTIKQPVNTWSAVGFAAAAFWALFMLRVGGPASANAPMRGPTFFSVGYAATQIFLWWGTMALHASWKAWGGFLDTFSIIVWLLFTIVYSFGRLLGYYACASVVRVLTFLAIFAGLTIPIALVCYHEPDARLVFLIVLGAILLAMEALVLIYQAAKCLQPGQTTARRRAYWYWWVLGSFAVAFLAKLLADFTGVWCAPDSAFQGHALWHISASVTAFFAYLYYRDEEYTPGLTRFD